MKIKNWREAVSLVASGKILPCLGYNTNNLGDALNIPYGEVKRECYGTTNNNIIKVYDIHTWMCTDTLVGFCLYTFNERLAAVSFQAARKSEEEFWFFSQEIAKEMKEYLWEKPNEEFPLVDLDEEIDQGWFTNGN